MWWGAHGSRQADLPAYLDVLAQHVHADLLGDLNVICKRCIRRRCVETIWPEALIQHTHLQMVIVNSCLCASKDSRSVACGLMVTNICMPMLIGRINRHAANLIDAVQLGTVCMN